MFRVLLVTLFLSLFVSFRQIPKDDHAEIRLIFHAIISGDSRHGSYYLIDSIVNYRLKMIDGYDQPCIIAESDETKSGVWCEGIFEKARIISGKKLQSLSQPDPFTMTPPHYRFSLPYFSKDKQTILIYYSYYCGNLCAERALRLYKLINGRWTYVESYQRVVS